MRIMVINAKGEIAVEINATGTTWMAHDDGFTNVGGMDGKAVAELREPLGLSVRDDLGREISAGCCTLGGVDLSRYSYTECTVHFSPGALELNMYGP